MKPPPLKKKPRPRKPRNKLPIDPGTFDPHKVHKDVRAEICERIAEGESLRGICQTTGFPAASTVCGWLRDPNQHAFAERYAQAREDRAALLADQIIEIVDDAKLDPADKRVRMDARKWLAAKMDPHRYGDKIEQHVSGRVDHLHSTQAQRLAALEAFNSTEDDD